MKEIVKVNVYTSQLPRELLEQMYREIQAKKADPNYKQSTRKKSIDRRTPATKRQRAEA